MNIKISKYYDKKQAEDYEKRRNNQTWHNENKVFNIIRDKILIDNKDLIEVLDVGAGTGRWIPYLNNLSIKYVATDISENMLYQAELKLKESPNEFKKNTKFIVSSVEELPINLSGKFDLIIMTRFLSHFSVNEINNILKIIRKYSKKDLIVSLRVAEKKLDIFFEIFNLITKSPLGAIKRYRKSGRLTYARLDSIYDKVIKDAGFNIIKKNVVSKDKYNIYEYWELRLNSSS